MPNYNVTFKENKKYFPATRTILVTHVDGAFSAGLLVADEFDSVDYKELLPKPSNKKITILDVKEVAEIPKKEKKNKSLTGEKS